MFTRDELIREALELDPLPASSTRLSQIFASEDWSLQDVAKTAALDQVLTGTLLRYVNSAASGSAQKITQVSQAVMRMGPGLVMSVALGQSVSGPMKSDLPAYGMEEGDLFRHSIASAIAIENMRRLGLKPPPGCFIAALVHDVGKLVVGRKLATMGIKISKDDCARTIETEQLGIDHAELGSAIAAAWELPEGVPEAVGGHHAPQEIEDLETRKVATFVAAADEVAHSIDKTEEEVGMNPVATTRFELPADAQAKLRETTREMLDGVMQLYA